MEIICDTNIWYNIGNGNIDSSIIEENDILVATYISVYELCFTENYLGNFQYIQNAVRAMLKYSSKHPIIEPPFAYLKVISDRNYSYNMTTNNDIFRFTEQIAKGCEIMNKKESEIETTKRKEELKQISVFCNEYVKNHIKPNIKDKKIHRKEDSIMLNRQLLNQLVSIQTKTDGLNNDFDWKRIGLFENVLKLYFNKLETGAIKSKPNDWFDLFILLYVNPNRKFWTKDERLMRLINEVGMGNYLYEINNDNLNKKTCP